MKSSILAVAATAVVLLAGGCGDSESEGADPGSTTDSSDSTDSTDSSASDGPSGTGDLDGSLAIFVEQTAKQLDAAAYDIDGSTVTLTFDEEFEEGVYIGDCQISWGVISAAGEGATPEIFLSYRDEQRNCTDEFR